jgi:hypothetical protein
MLLLNDKFVLSLNAPAQCSIMLSFIGMPNSINACGPLSWTTLVGCTTVAPIVTPDGPLLKSSPKAAVFTLSYFGFGSSCAHALSYIRSFKMVDPFQNGNHVLALVNFLVFLLNTMILNLTTHHISPQFHLIFDEKFTTVQPDMTNESIVNDLFEQLTLSPDHHNIIFSDDDDSGFDLDLLDNVDLPLDDPMFTQLPSQVLTDLPSPPSLVPI